MSIVTQRQVPQVQTVPSPSINQVTKHVDFLQTQYIDKFCPRAHSDTATGPLDRDVFGDCESPAGAVRRDSGECACESSSVMPQQAPHTQNVEKVEVRPLPFIGRIVDVPRQCHRS